MKTISAGRCFGASKQSQIGAGGERLEYLPHRISLSNTLNMEIDLAGRAETHAPPAERHGAIAL